VQEDDELWDGLEWVTHSGLLDQGEKDVLACAGVRATRDHLFFSGGVWKPWSSVAERLACWDPWSDVKEARATRDADRRDGAISRTQTYDLKDCGPRSRFTIWSDVVPLIAHNCGYGASGAALVDYAAGMNITMGLDDADRAITIFRESFWEIPLLWRNLEAAAKSAVQNPGREYRAYACAGQNQYGPLYRDWPFVSYYKEGDFLYCGLPSGRTLFYYKPEVISERRRSVRTGNDYNAQTLYYWGKRQEAGGAWGFISTWGGMWLENVCQATCRDVLYNGLELMHQDPGIEICGHVYDEIIALVDEADGPAAYDHMVGYMTTRPPWADERFFLGAEGYHSAKRYRK